MYAIRSYYVRLSAASKMFVVGISLIGGGVDSVFCLLSRNRFVSRSWNDRPVSLIDLTGRLSGSVCHRT